MENIFKLLVGRLIIKTEELFKQVKQKPMMSDNYLFSVVFINFEKIKPKKNLNSETYIQIMLLYVMGWLEEYMDEVQDEKYKNQCTTYLLCWFYKYLVGVVPIQIANETEFVLLQMDVNKIISNKRLTANKKKIIVQMGRWNAACDKDKNETDTPLILVLHEWMQFKDLI
jgi:hypothetical protein